MSENLADYINGLNEDYVRFISQTLADNGLTQGLLSFLMYIGDHPNCSPSEMACAIKADSGYTTRSVQKLVASGIVVRERHQSDGRAYVLRLTSLGSQKFYEVQERYVEWEDRVTDGLDADERELLLRILSKLAGIRRQ